MKLLRPRRFQWNYLIMAFLLPLMGMLCVRLVSSLTFSGKYSLLYSDCYHQYYPFFKAFRSALLSGQSLLHSWNVGLGMDYLGLIAYYLGSPLNLFSVLIPESWMLGYFGLLMPLKLGFAGLFFAIFLKNIFRKDDLSITLFGGFYALCSWALGYQWNIMWLDTFALLPLVMLGMVSLLKERKFVLYTVSLFFSVCINYYIGFFVCIFVFLSFICYQICRWESLKKLFADFCRIALFSLLAIGMTLFLTLPALSALQGTQSSVNKFPEEFRLNIADENTFLGLLDAMRQVAGNTSGGIEPTYKEGLPNLYCGIVTNVLAILFLFCKEVKIRDKVCSVVLLLLLNVSFIIRQLDYIWHGFHFTNMIPYRFSFLYSFVMLYMAYRAWLHRRNFRKWQFLAAGILAFALVFCSNEIKPFFKLISGNQYLLPWVNSENALYNLQTIASDCSYLAYNLLFLLAYLAAFLFGCRPALPQEADEKMVWLDRVQFSRKASRIIVLSVCGLELIMILVNFGILFPMTNVSNYPMGTSDTAAVIEHMHRSEEGALFYRAETTHSQTLNDGALNGYNGVSAFTSSANVKVTNFMKSLGFGAKNTYNRYCYEDSSPIANLFLNLKYMIERSGNVKKNPYFNDVYSSGNTHLLLNNAYLPLGFMADPQILNVDFSIENPFQLQNALMQAATGISEDCWHFVTGKNVMIHGSNVVLSSQNETGHCSYNADGDKGKITFFFTADMNGLLCFHVDQTQRNNFTVYINDEETALFTESYTLPQTLSACNVNLGDVIRIEFTCKSGKSGTIHVTAAILDDAVFQKCYQKLASSTLNLTNFSTTCVEGTIECNSDGVLYTSIPQDGNWTAKVDGEPVQIAYIGDVMCCLLLPEGKHTVEFKYQNLAFNYGLAASLLCLAVFLILYYFNYKPKLQFKKGKYSK